MHRYVEVPYTSFRCGDIVEATFSLLAVPVKPAKYCMKLVLRGLSLEESGFTTVSNIKLKEFES